MNIYLRFDLIREFNFKMLQLREKVAEKFKADLECVCLIFAGKILKDFETLETHSKFIWGVSGFNS